ncbi:hypothetical protein Droror1_Dr00011781 [Drosera rotundifolia]
MAFHVACPITCKRICDCELGFRDPFRAVESRVRFVEEVLKLEELIRDPWLVRVREKATVKVPVPKIVVVRDNVVGGGGAEGDGDEDVELEGLSGRDRRVVLQRRAAVASLANEDFARRFEAGVVATDAPKEHVGEEQGLSNVNVMCRICFSGENEGSERSKQMISCRSCTKKYHRSCLKVWAKNRDLFHWSSLTCPSCRVCEVCRRTGDPNKFKFCRRCDGAYHCYCMQPPHKNTSSGPYLCPKHTRCHSCGSTVPGNGSSLRWFLGYTCCDACGRLFTKGNYCPVCLKVYRDSESTPMVCCDICQRWVHCDCDSISDEKYLQFQVDGNLPYTCPTCRGECYQVRDLEDAVQELWRRRDEEDRDLIANLRAAAGLPTQDEIFSISPFSDDEDDGPLVKTEHGRMRLSFKDLGDHSPKTTKESVKKPSKKKHGKKKEYPTVVDNMTGFGHDSESFGRESSDRENDMQIHKSGQNMFPTPPAEGSSPAEGMCSINQQGIFKHKFVEDVSGIDERKGIGALRIKSKKFGTVTTSEDAGKDASEPKAVKGTKLVIHLGVRNKSISNSPISDSSNYHQDQGLTTSSGYKADGSQKKERMGNLIKLGKSKHDVPNLYSTSDRGNGAGGNGLFTPGKAYAWGNDSSLASAGYQEKAPKGEKASLRKHPADISVDGHSKKSQASGSKSISKDSKPSLKVKFKSPYQVSWGTDGEEEKGSIKGQRSKRKRTSLYGEKPNLQEDEDVTDTQSDDLMNGMTDAGILRRLGKDSIGKRVEVRQSSDDSWHRGVVSTFNEGSGILSVDLDDGRSKTIDLGKHGIRFVLDKQKRPRA